MKIKINIPADDGSWPSQYVGQLVEVSVEQVKFPDQTVWHVNHLGLESIAEGHSASVESQVQAGIIGNIGAKPKTIHIEFFEETKP